MFITQHGNVRIGDFGLATRWPRVSAVDILLGANVNDQCGYGTDGIGLGSASVPPSSIWSSVDARARIRSVTGPPVDAFEREGDREYIAPEVLSGRYGKHVDIFSSVHTAL